MITRAWIMAVRQREDGVTYNAAEARFKSLENTDYARNIKHVVSLLGHFDVCAVYHGDNHQDAYEFVKVLRRRIGTTVRSTTTYISVYPDSREYPDPTKFGAVAASILGIRCTASASNELVDHIRSIPCVMIADAVWGDFDIIALVVRGRGKSDRPSASVIRDIYDLPGVEKITTMREAKE